jgi:hypothetical protein
MTISTNIPWLAPAACAAGGLGQDHQARRRIPDETHRRPHRWDVYRCSVPDTEQHMTCIHKVPTTPEDPAIGVLQGTIALCTTHGICGQHIDHALHGTTIATDVVPEHGGAITGMVTIRDCPDIVHS